MEGEFERLCIEIAFKLKVQSIKILDDISKLSPSPAIQLRHAQLAHRLLFEETVNIAEALADAKKLIDNANPTA